MGCGGSRDSDENKIDYHMEWIAASQINDFFQQCETILKQAENLRAGLEDTREEMYDICCVQFLKNPHVLMDVVKVWVWTLATINDGDIAKCKITPSKEAPYLDGDIGKQCSHCSNNPNMSHTGCANNQCAKFKEALKIYIQTCIEGVKQLPEVLQNLQELGEKAKTLKEQASDALSHHEPLDKARNMGKVGQNTLKLTKAIGKLKNIQLLVPEAVKNMEQVINEFQDVCKDANDQAKKALEKKIVLPGDIMQHLHPGNKYSESQIKKMKAETEKKRKQQEEEKRKKDLFANAKRIVQENNLKAQQRK